jgi:hypothetical protein
MNKVVRLAMLSISLSVSPTAVSDPCNCRGYKGPGGDCYAGPGGPAYAGPGGRDIEVPVELLTTAQEALPIPVLAAPVTMVRVVPAMQAQAAMVGDAHLFAGK